MNRTLPLLAAAGLAATGCATYATFGLLQQTLGSVVIVRALSLQLPASPPTVTTFVGWNPTGGTVTKITRENSSPISAGPVTREFTSGQFTAPLLTDASVSSDVTYRYTLSVQDGDTVATHSNVITPVSPVEVGPSPVSPGGDLISVGIAPDSPAFQATGKPTFTWSELTGKRSDYNYGYFLLCGTMGASGSLSASNISPVYSAFLDESKHKTGVAFGTRSDLQGFSTDLLSYLKGAPGLSLLAPRDSKADGTDLDALPSGTYVWTLLVVNTDLRHISFGIGKFPADPGHLFSFKVP